MSTRGSKNGAAPKLKIPTRRVLSDDFALHPDMVTKDGEVVDWGTAYNIHAGEWVDVLPVHTMREFFSLAQLSKMQVTEMVGEKTQVAEVGFELLCIDLADRIVAWNWTDLRSRPYDQPDGNPEVIRQLSSEELFYLVNLTGGGEAPAEGKAVATP